jgi:hypothetical protein
MNSFRKKNINYTRSLLSERTSNEVFLINMHHFPKHAHTTWECYCEVDAL